MNTKRRLDNTLDLAIGHQRPDVRLDQAMLADLARGILDPWQGQLDRPRVTTVWGLDSVRLSGRILLHSMSRSSDVRHHTGRLPAKPERQRETPPCAGFPLYHEKSFLSLGDLGLYRDSPNWTLPAR